MELPIQLKFFKKLDLYQVLRTQNEKAAGKDNTWLLEKRLLHWTVWNHHHLRTPLTDEAALLILHKDPRAQKIDYGYPLLVEAMSNLVERGYASESSSVEGIRFTREGLLMGDVISDVESGAWGPGLVYKFVYFCVWLIVIATACGAIIVIVNFYELISPLLHRIFGPFLLYDGH